MGSGKTTLLELWREDFPGRTCDLDAEIAKSLNIKPENLGEWIENEGFEKFRAVESEILEDLLKESNHLLLSLGGGAYHQKNRSLMKKYGPSKSLWLKACPATLWERVKNDQNRPLVKLGRLAFDDLHSQRLSDYNEADFILHGESPFPLFSHWLKTQPEIASLLDV